MNEWLFDPRFQRSRKTLETDPRRSFLDAQALRDEYGWRDPELGAYDHDAFMRYWWREDPLSAGVVGLPASMGYPAIKATAQAPWTQPLLLMATPGLMAAARSTGLPQASPATMAQLGAGVSGWLGGLLDWIER